MGRVFVIIIAPQSVSYLLYYLPYTVEPPAWVLFLVFDPILCFHRAWDIHERMIAYPRETRHHFRIHVWSILHLYWRGGGGVLPLVLMYGWDGKGMSYFQICLCPCIRGRVVESSRNPSGCITVVWEWSGEGQSEWYDEEDQTFSQAKDAAACKPEPTLWSKLFTQQKNYIIH